jgi:hypothetical protein
LTKYAAANSLTKAASAAARFAAADAAASAAAEASAAAAEAAAADDRADVAFHAAFRADAAFDAARAAAYAAATAVRWADADGDPVSLLLWPEGVPTEAAQLWKQLQRDLRGLDAGFQVWIDSYQDRLDGKPFDWGIERQWALLSKEQSFRQEPTRNRLRQASDSPWDQGIGH